MELTVDLQKLFEELDTLIDQEGLLPGEFTVRIYAENRGVTYKDAYGMINRAIAQGLIEEVKREVLVEGRRIKRVYRRCIKA